MGSEVNRTTTVHSGRVFSLVTENVTLENGATVDMDLIRHPGAAAIVAITTDRKLKLVHQYRHAVGCRLWEIPAGTLEPGETPRDCAARELAEEAGAAAEKWLVLGEITPVPGYSDERIHLFLATGLSPEKQHLDRDEVLEVFDMPLASALDMVDTGEIVDGKTIAGLLLADRYLRNALS